MPIAQGNKLLFLTILLLAFLSVKMAHADVSISGLDDITINAWAGLTGDLQGADDYCTLSFRQLGNGRLQPRNYIVAASTSGTTDPSGNFYITNVTNPTSTLLVTFEWAHPGSGTYTMLNYADTLMTARGRPGATNCGETNSQTTITMTVPAATLASAIAGTYSEEFRISICRGFECLFNVRFTVTLPELIQVTGLQNFSFGSWPGVGDVQSSNDFCVFRNGYGVFALTATGNNDLGSNFRVNAGTNTIPYDIDFSDGGGVWHGVSPGTQLSGSTTGFTGNSTRDCAGGTSHSMRVTFQESALSGATAGSYSDTVVIIVEPE